MAQGRRHQEPLSHLAETKLGERGKERSHDWRFEGKLKSNFLVNSNLSKSHGVSGGARTSHALLDCLAALRPGGKEG